jgi:glycerophosphoryl diester phosphodiesterase
MLSIAHRGASAYYPENTLAAFRSAIEMGADGIELDVHQCKSGELVVIHDDTVNRTTDGKGKVAQMTFAQLQQLTIKGGEHIPTLDEVINAVGKKAYFFIEIKYANAALKTAGMIMDYVAKGWSHERLILISFQHQALLEALQAFSSLVIGASFDKLTQSSVLKAKNMGAQYMLPRYTKLNKSYLAQAREQGLKVVAWTANRAASIAHLRDLGVDGIISNYPDRVR